MKKGLCKLNIKSRAGMTLVEVLIAIALFAVVALPLFGMFSNSMRMERRALVESIATYTAQMKMEEAYGRTATDLLDDFHTDGNKVDETIILSDDPEDPDSIALYYIIATEPDVGSPNLIKVSITVGNEYFAVESTLENLIRPVPTIEP